METQFKKFENCKQFCTSLNLRNQKDTFERQPTFIHSFHSHKRASQRGISLSNIAIVLEFGTTYFKQGLTYYILGEKDIPNFLVKDKSHLVNMVVIIGGYSNKIVTCYKSNKAFKQIKLKSKELVNNKIAA